MLTPGIHYAHRNATQQLIGILPGRNVYLRDNNVIPYTAGYTHTVALPADAAKSFAVGLRITAGDERVFLNHVLLSPPSFTYANGTLQLGTSVTIADGDLLQVCASAAVMTYVNAHLGQGIGSSVLVQLNGATIGTPRILDSAGTYCLDFIPPLGTFSIKSVFPDNTTQTQQFISKKLYTFLDALGEEYADLKTEAAIASSSLYSAYRSSGILRGQADGDAMAGFGDLVGFPRPFDWSPEFYANVLGGNLDSGIPGLLPTLRKGSTTGAVKDIVDSVTGYVPSDADFKLLQRVRWQLSRDGAKWAYGGVVGPGECTPLDTAAAGPHYYLTSNRTPANAVASPVAVLESDIRKAFTILLNVRFDGFFLTDGEWVVRSPLGDIDKLQYTWLNPWSSNALIDYLTGYTLEEFTVAELPYPLATPPAAGQEIVYLNGLEVADANYTIIAGVLTLVGLTTLPTDRVQVEYCLAGPNRWHDEMTYPSGRANPAEFQLPQLPIPDTLNVFVNGKRLDVLNGDYVFVSPDLVQISVPLLATDRIDFVYQDTSAEMLYEDSQPFATATPPVFSAPFTIVQGSVRVYVNGVRAPEATYAIALNGVTVTINYTGPGGLSAIDGDMITVTCTCDPLVGYNVKIMQGTTEYSQGYHFSVNYTTGEIIWDPATAIPADNSSYQVYYTYFPKDSLDRLLALVKPAPMRLFLQFTTTNDEIFRPFYWDGVINPSGDVILP